MKPDESKPLPPTELADPPLPLSGAEADRIPERIGSFRVIDIIARGMAVVYKAEQAKPKRTVALKIPRGGRLLAEDARKRFLREVELAARLHHSSIVPVLETGEIDGVPFYTMPFIEGRSLSGHIVTAQPSRADRLSLFLKICNVVHALHAEGLIHRDLKPENIMIDRFGDIRLLDFGLARALAENDGVTGHQLIGTLQYMAPEQTLPANQSKLTPAADVYALGVILYQLLTDALPYKADGSLAAAVDTIRSARPVPPSSLKPDLGTQFDDVVLSCLEKDPLRRPRDAGALAALIHNAVAGRVARAGAASARREGIGIRALAWPLIAGGLALIAAALMIPRPAAETEATPAPAPPPEPGLAAFEAAPDAAPQARMELLPADDRVIDNAPPGSDGLPPDLWSAYSHARKELSGKYEYRRYGAVLIRSPRPGDLTWEQAGLRPSDPVPLSIDQTAVLYAPPGPVTIRWTDGIREAARVVNIEPGKVAGIVVEETSP